MTTESPVHSTEKWGLIGEQQKTETKRTVSIGPLLVGCTKRKTQELKTGSFTEKKTTQLNSTTKLLFNIKVLIYFISFLYRK